MCSIFSTIQPETYSFQTRSVRLGGHATSIRLETMYWNILEEIAGLQSISLGKFLTKLHDEVLEFRGETMNFASLLRCACMVYISEIRDRPEARERFFLESRHISAHASSIPGHAISIQAELPSRPKESGGPVHQKITAW